MEYSPQVARYGMQEIRLTGESGGNPYIEREVFGEFTGAHESKRVRGFYDGEGVYKVRFMPAFEGEYSFRITGNYVDGAEEHTGRFDVVPPRSGEHGPVHAVGARLYYADGTAHVDIGTTCYVWTWQTDAMVERTLESLRRGPRPTAGACATCRSTRRRSGRPTKLTMPKTWRPSARSIMRYSAIHFLNTSGRFTRPTNRSTTGVSEWISCW